MTGSVCVCVCARGHANAHSHALGELVGAGMSQKGSSQLEVNWGPGAARPSHHRDPRRQRWGRGGEDRCAKTWWYQREPGSSEGLRLRCGRRGREEPGLQRRGAGRGAQEAGTRHRLKARRPVWGSLRILRRPEQRRSDAPPRRGQRRSCIGVECGALGTELEGAFETPFIRGARAVIHSEEGRAPDPWISSCCSVSEDPLLPLLSPSGSKARRCRDGLVNTD